MAAIEGSGSWRNVWQSYPFISLLEYSSFLYRTADEQEANYAECMYYEILISSSGERTAMRRRQSRAPGRQWTLKAALILLATKQAAKHYNPATI